jgi:polyisoprenoid-binding protein YceI
VGASVGASAIVFPAARPGVPDAIRTALSAAAWPTATLGAQAQTATHAIDPTQTFLTCEVLHFGVTTNRRRFDQKTGSVQLDKAGKTSTALLKAANFGCHTNPMLKVAVCGGDCETTIVRRPCGMGWRLNFGIADSVRLVIQVEAIRQP